MFTAHVQSERIVACSIFDCVCGDLGHLAVQFFFGMAIFQEKWETDMFFTQFSKFTHWHQVQVHSVHKVASWNEGGHTDNRHHVSIVNMGLLALKEGRQIIFPFSTNFLHWWSRTVRVYHPPCVLTTLQASARDEILASGGSLSHHHGGTYITIYFSHAFQLHHMQIFWEFVQKWMCSFEWVVITSSSSHLCERLVSSPDLPSHEEKRSGEPSRFSWASGRFSDSVT